jgi:membrane protease YdiL (CAAX protease family)
MIARHRRRPGHDRVLIFFVIAFLLSWLPWPLVLLNPDSSPMVPFGPLLAAVVAAALSGGLRSVRGLLGQLGRWRSAPRWYLAGLLLPVALTWLSVELAVVAGGSAAVHRPLDWAEVATTFASTVILVGLFEEVGWRGYAFDALQRRWSGLRPALLVGVVWALWHLPLLVSDPTRQRPALQFVILVIAQSLFFSWLYNSTTAGLVVVILGHAAVDTAARFMLPQFTGSSYQLVWWIQTVLWVVLAIVAALQLQHGGRSVGGTRPSERSPVRAGRRLSGEGRRVDA